MIRIEASPWRTIVDHAVAAYPLECCGILLGEELASGERVVTAAYPCANAYEGGQSDRFAIDPADQLRADRLARAEGLDVLGFFHSHPDHGMYFSATDLKHSWPWYSNVVVSIVHGRYAGAGSFRADEERTAAAPEELVVPQLLDGGDPHG
jgi:proteasome lid subunit RPN8/RPN11